MKILQKISAYLKPVTQSRALKSLAQRRRGLEIAAVFVLGVVGAFDFLLQPLGVGLAVRDLSLSQSQAGLFASFEMAGGVLSAVLALFWIRRLSWRSIAIANLFLLVGGYLLSTRLETFPLLSPARFLVGFAGGNLLAITLAWLSDTSQPERYGGFFRRSSDPCTDCRLRSLAGNGSSKSRPRWALLLPCHAGRACSSSALRGFRPTVDTGENRLASPLKQRRPQESRPHRSGLRL